MQTSYQNQSARSPQAGVIADLGCSNKIISRKAGGAVAKRYTTTVDTANLGTDSLSFVFSNPALSKTVSLIPSAAVKETIRDEMITAVNSDPDVASKVLAAVDPGNTDKLFLTAILPGLDFTLTTSADLSRVTTTSNSDNESIGFGLLAVFVAAMAGVSIQPPRSTNFALQVIHATPTDNSTDTYTMNLIADLNGDGIDEVYTASMTSAAGGVQGIVEALQLALLPQMPANTIAITEDNLKVIFTSLRAGLRFQVTGTVQAVAAPTGTWTIATITPNAGPNVAGITVFKQAEQDANGDTAYLGGQDVNVMREGYIWVELDADVVTADIVAGAPVWVRMVATGDEVLGAFRAAADAADCFLLPAAQFAWNGDGISTGLDDRSVTRLRVSMP